MGSDQSNSNPLRTSRFRSALAADNLQKMGYTNVLSMDGGIRDWRNKGYPLTTG